MIPPQLLLASNNAGKLAEFRALLAPLGCAVLAQGDLQIPEAAEPFDTFLENALAKARHASALAGMPALADDSGLCVPALGGAPGVQSARYAGEPRSDARNNALLLERLHAGLDRSAWFACTLVLVNHPEDPDPLVAQGRWPGRIVEAPRGDGGFGYDPLFEPVATSLFEPVATPRCEPITKPLFEPVPSGLTAAQLAPAVKNAISHRALALQGLVAAHRGRSA